MPNPPAPMTPVRTRALRRRPRVRSRRGSGAAPALPHRLEFRRGTFPGLRDVQLGSEEQAVRALELAHDFLGKVVALQSYAVQAIKLDRIAHRLDERRHVLRNAR